METFDYASQFDRIKKDVAQAISKTLDIRAARTGLRLQAKDIWVDDSADSSDWKSQHEAVRKDQTWGVPVFGTVDLVDAKTGKTLSTIKRIKLATLPKPTDFGSFIVDGKHYQVQSQLRRKPGIYVTQQESGEIKTEINIAGRPFDVEYNPQKSVFQLAVKSGDSKQHVPLYPVLSRMGISDSMLAKAWGEDVLAKNKAIKSSKAAESVIKAAGLFQAGSKFDSADDAAKALHGYFEETELRPEVTERTIGKAYDKVSPEAIVVGSKELLRTIAGQRGTDDRHALEYKKAFSLADLMRERFLKPTGELSEHMDQMRRKIAYKLDNVRNRPSQASTLVSASQFTPAMTAFFTKTEGLSGMSDQTNPINMLNGMTKITVLGEGGLSDPRRGRNEEHELHPSHFGFLDPVHTPDSERIGLVANLAIGATKKGDSLQTAVYDLKQKKSRTISPDEAARLVVGFPDQYRDGKPIDKKIKAMAGGERVLVDPKDVDVVLKSSRQVFSIASNTMPFMPAIAGVRAQMATKMLEQAIPLLHREAPRVQVKIGPGKTIEDAIGSGFSIHALDDGVIKSISKNRIVVGTKDGEIEHPLYSNLPLNGQSFVDATPTVKVGDKIAKGDVIADSNFTKNGTLAIGTNLTAAYLPWKGYNFEDGIVLTESAAKKLTSEHLHQHAYSAERGADLGLSQYRTHNPGGLDLEKQGKLEADGVVKKGMILHKGDPIWVGAKDPRTDDPEANAQRRLGQRPGRRAFIEEWPHSVPGEVVDVVRKGKAVKVYVKSHEPAQIGDKLTNRHAAKGVITKIIPDGQAPHRADGSPVDIILNPHGIVGRINPSQILETSASKLAQVDENGHVTKPYVVDNTDPGDSYAQSVSDQLAKAGLSDEEELFDPHSNQSLGKILVGPQYMLKLSKQATSQFSARSPMDPKRAFDVHGNPREGGEEGGKALDMLTFYSMLAHGSRANLQEMATFKGTKNQPFWDWLAAGTRTGMLKPPPEPTFAYKKFEAYMKAAGVNMERRGSKIILQPMTDREVVGTGGRSGLSKGALVDPVFMRGKNLKEEKGGLMDDMVFGGRQGTNWGHIELAEPVPNPIFEKPIKTLLGLKDAQFKGIVRGDVWVDPETGELGDHEFGKQPHTVTGGAAIKAMLGKVDIDQQMAEWTDKAKTSTRPEKLDEANKHLKYLAALKKLKIRPEDAYVQTKLPVLPPIFRPVLEMDDGTLSNAGLNTLYRDVALVNNELKWQNDQSFVPDSLTSDTRHNLYEGVKALNGLGMPIAPYPGSRKPKGIVEQIAGSEGPKKGFFQYQVLRRRQEPVGRAAILPEPKLGVDEIGIPEDMAWKIFEPFVMRRLVTRTGMHPSDASLAIKNRTVSARAALESEMEDRPVLANRAPSLHKFSIMAFKPKITDGMALKIPPLVVKGFGADFDGDTMTIHVPVLPDAVKEAEGMLPSKHLYNPGTGAIMLQPQNEAALGLYLMSGDPQKRQEVLGVLPPELQAKYKDKILDKKNLNELTQDLATSMPDDYGKIVDKLKSMGDEHTYRSGFTVGLKDILPHLPERQQIFEHTKKEIDHLDLATPQGKAKAAKIIENTDEQLKGMLNKRLAEQGNNLHLMVRSGARGNIDQLKQIVSAPFSVPDHHGNAQSVPIMRSFAEGLPLSDYWATLYGARSAAVDKQLQTAEPGAFNKDIMASTITNVISSNDCGATDGLDMPVPKEGSGSSELAERFLARDVRAGNAVLGHAGDQVTPALLNTLRDRHVKSLLVRSPLTCKAPKGTCAKCFGLDVHGQLPSVGTNVGAIAGQALSEPLTQMTLRTIHGGGVTGTRGAVSGYEQIDKLLKMEEIKRGKATLARHGGKVTRVEDVAGGGGKNVYIGDDDTPHFIEKGLWEDGKLRVGASVAKGDILSRGLVQPQELVDLKGMLAAQDYVAGQIHQAYHGQGFKLKRKIAETVIRSVGNTTKVIRPGDSPFLPGDTIPWTVAEDHNNTKLGEIHTDDAGGHVLHEDVPGVHGAKKGATITDELQSALKKMGKHKVTVGPKPIIHEPYLAGVKSVPFLRKDWMAQMGYQRLSEAVVGGAAAGHETDIHDYSPVPAFAYGAEFGNAPGGRSKKEGVY